MFVSRFAFSAHYRATIWSLLIVVFLVELSHARLIVAAEPPAGTSRSPELSERERQFEKMISGAALIGHFTVTGQEDGVKPRKERYTLQKVAKRHDGKWLFLARIQYGEHDVTVPLPLPVEWAGDTPVIIVDKLPVPGLGEYSARVLIHDGRYAGYWQGHGHGGHLFGTIERAAERHRGERID